jgi:L-rhamnose mutarotase
MSKSEQYAFAMRLYTGCEREYEEHHDRIPKELLSTLRRAGISNYSIFLDPETRLLFGILDRTATHTMDRLRDDPEMRNWWNRMADLMATTDDNEPIVRDLRRVFHMR